MSWFSVLKRQMKLPKEITDGASISDRDAKDWFKARPKAKPLSTKIPKERAEGQTTLNLGEEE
tara:strand:+ start:766 stop:954 length:189 start_codon:yes stop_codon:yes gene_type:complete